MIHLTEKQLHRIIKEAVESVSGELQNGLDMRKARIDDAHKWAQDEEELRRMLDDINQEYTEKGAMGQNKHPQATPWRWADKDNLDSMNSTLYSHGHSLDDIKQRAIKQKNEHGF